METTGIMGIMQGVYRDNGKENGNYRDHKNYSSVCSVRWTCIQFGKPIRPFVVLIYCIVCFSQLGRTRRPRDVWDCITTPFLFA